MHLLCSMPSGVFSKRCQEEMIDIYFDVFGTKIKVSSCCLNFISALKENLFYFKSRASKECDIEIYFEYINFPFKKDLNKFNEGSVLVCSTGAKVYSGEGSISIADFNIPGLSIKAKVDNWNYTINARYKLSKKSFILRRTPGPEDFLKISRYLLQYPLFQLMRERKGLFFIHASAIEINGAGYVFFGLPGSGKSRCVMQLLRNEGAHFISDNFLFFNTSKELFAFPELLRIYEHWGSSWRENSHVSRINIGKTKKSFFRVSEDTIKGRAKIQKAFFLKRAGAEKLAAVDTQEFISTLLAVEKFTKDFYEYSYIDLLNLSGVKLASLDCSRRSELAYLLNGIDCYDLFIEEGSANSRLLERIL